MLKRHPFLPTPISLLSGALLYALLIGFGAVASMVVPSLLELMRTQPRLAMIAFLGLVLSPALVVVIAHHFGHRALDGIDAVNPTKALPRIRSWWAGAQAWLVLYGTSVLTSLVMLVINPPEPEPDSAAGMATGLAMLVSSFGATASKYTSLSNLAGLHTIVWVLIAAQLYQLERAAHRRPRRKDEADV